MQRPRFLRRLGHLLVAAIVVGFASCRDLLGPGDASLDPSRASGALIPPGRGALEIAPAGRIELLVGDTVTIRATGRHGTAGLVFASSDTMVAEVTNHGLVTARLPGAARIGVALEADARVTAALEVQVLSRGPSAVSLRSLRYADSRTVPADSVAGTFLASFEIERGDASRLEVLVDSVPACILRLPRLDPGKTEAPGGAVECMMNVAAFDTVTGVPRLYNGPASLSARLVRGDGLAVAYTASVPIVLRNTNTLATVLTSTRTAMDTLGATWLGGDLSVTARPVLYQRGAGVRAVRFEYRANDSWTLVAVDSTAPFGARFGFEQLIGRVDSFQVRVSGETGEATGAPEVVTHEMYYDAIPPPAGAIRSREWIGADFVFNSLYVVPAATDRGVSGTYVKMVAGTGNQSLQEILARGNYVVHGRDLPQSGPAAYLLVYFVCDALENCAERAGFHFGVDLEPPVVTQASVADRAINPAGELRFSVQDSRSGVSETPLDVVVSALFPGAVRPVCGPTIEDLLATPPSDRSSCLGVQTGLGLALPPAVPGYYTYQVVAVDRAGNRTAPIFRTFIIDSATPTIESFTLPTRFVPGEEAVVSAKVSDNLDLADVSFSLGYPLVGGGRLNLPFAASVAAGVPFGSKLTPTATASARFPFVRSITYLAPGAARRSTTVVDSILAHLADAAQLTSRTSRGLAPASFGGNVSTVDPFAAVTSITATATPVRVCTVSCTAADPSTLGVTIRVVGEPGMSAMSRMYLFARDRDGVVVQLASTPSFSVVETGTQRSYVYSFNSAPPPALRGPYAIFGVAVSNGGNGLMTADVPVDFYAR